MAVLHSRNLAIQAGTLLDLGKCRLEEAELLRSSGLYSGAVFLGGCAVECFLKHAICKTLRLEGLPVVFKTHDLQALILYSGHQQALHERPDIKESFDEVLAEWGGDGRERLLYNPPLEVTEARTVRFFKALTDPLTGVIPWLRNMTL